MKNISLVINAVLAAAVVMLYVLMFSGDDKKTTTEESQNVETVKVSGDIAYVSIDSIASQYKMAVDLRDQLIEKQKISEAELNDKVKKFESSVADFQNKVQKQLITKYQATEMQAQLQQEEQNLYQVRESYTRDLMEEEQVNQRRILVSIMDYLKDNYADHQYILSNSLYGDNILFANEKLDITVAVIEGLNAAYNPTDE